MINDPPKKINMPGFSNPFYSNNTPEIPLPPSETRPNRPAGFGVSSTSSSSGAGAGASAPPSYAASTTGPTQYKSLKDLTRGQQRPVPPPPPPGRPSPAAPGTGYGQSPYDSQAAGGYGRGGDNRGEGGASGRYSDGRNMPPAPGNYGRGIPNEPPRRNVGGECLCYIALRWKAVAWNCLHWSGDRHKHKLT